MKNIEKQLACIDEYLSSSVMDGGEKAMLKDIAKYAAELGYSPRYQKNSHGQIVYLGFIKSSVRRTLMKFRIWGHYEDIAFYQKENEGKVQLILSFFATPEYSEVFHQGIKRVIEEFDGKYTGCYGCGKCKGGLNGYTYIYPDGKKIFRCGGELVELPYLHTEYTEEVKKLIKTQDDFWVGQLVG